MKYLSKPAEEKYKSFINRLLVEHGLSEKSIYRKITEYITHVRIVANIVFPDPAAPVGRVNRANLLIHGIEDLHEEMKLLEIREPEIYILYIYNLRDNKGCYSLHVSGKYNLCVWTYSSADFADSGAAEYYINSGDEHQLSEFINYYDLFVP